MVQQILASWSDIAAFLEALGEEIFALLADVTEVVLSELQLGVQDGVTELLLRVPLKRRHQRDQQVDQHAGAPDIDFAIVILAL